MSDSDLRAKILSVLSYCPETGEFTWATARTWRRAAGSVAGGTLDGKGYPRIGVFGKRYTAHRLAWFLVNGEWPAEDLDHINGVRTDNRLCNLRLASRSQNNFNKGALPHSSTGVKGVWKHKPSGRWRASIKKNGKSIHLGYFATVEEAHAAYSDALRFIAGEFARAA